MTAYNGKQRSYVGLWGEMGLQWKEDYLLNVIIDIIAFDR